MTGKTDTVPSINKTAFSCPHCNAFTTQHWYKPYLDSFSEDNRTPNIPEPSAKEVFQNNKNIDKETKLALIEWVDKMTAGKPYVQVQSSSCYSKAQLMNVNISKCYNCKEFTLWEHDKIVYPNTKVDILPNADLPAHIKKLFEEAREIVGASPKGAAALLRLSIQYMCKELGESGKNIDKDIANLVSKGLNPLVQQALDVVRVIGNEAVHPGEIDLDDNRDTALQLFNVVNLIATQMISHPKQVKALYGNLPDKKLEGIKQRDKKSNSENKNT